MEVLQLRPQKDARISLLPRSLATLNLPAEAGYVRHRLLFWFPWPGFRFEALDFRYLLSVAPSNVHFFFALLPVLYCCPHFIPALKTPFEKGVPRNTEDTVWKRVSATPLAFGRLSLSRVLVTQTTPIPMSSHLERPFA